MMMKENVVERERVKDIWSDVLKNIRKSNVPSVKYQECAI